jgi:hypothetical protein
VLGLGGVLAWTWIVVENARRLVSLATTNDPPRPWAAVASWALPIGFVLLAAVAVAWTAASADDSTTGDSSAPFIVALVALLLLLPLMYRPLTALSGVVRRLGGSTVELVQWVWVPIVTAAVGVGALAVLELLGAFDDSADTVPLWAVAVVALGPCVLLLLLGWRAAAAVEDAVDLAFDRRVGRRRTNDRPRHRLGHTFDRLVFGRGSARAQRDARGRVRQVPGADLLRIALVTMIAGLALVGVVGAVVMFLFWQEARDGVLLQSQRDRVVDVLATLRDLERILTFVVVWVAAAWSFVAVTNVRLAAGRRRNPLIAAISWPAAGAAVWLIGERAHDGGSTARVVVGFVAQAAVLYVPFLLLERSAAAVGARQTPFRITWGFGVILLVHVEGLGGLSTVNVLGDADGLGRTAGYLLLGALVTLLATLAVTGACSSLQDACEHEVDHHNFLVAHRGGAQPIAPA